MRRLLYIAALSLLAFGPAVALRAQDAFFTQGQPTEVELTVEDLADRIVDYAATFLGTPYRYGANGPKRFDCTAYTRYVYRHFGIDELSRSSRDQSHDGREVDISDPKNLQKGDILLLGSRRNPKVVGHVGIFIGLDESGTDPRFIHASNHGVRYSSIYTESYYSNRLLGARRILPDFYDPEVVFDTTATYAFNPEEGVRIAPDSLALSDTDRRIVLFENGKWAYVSADGTLTVPDTTGRIVLSGDGNWMLVRPAMITVPAASLVPEPKEPEAPVVKPVAPKDSTAVAAADTTATQPAAQPEMIYHTVAKGDTLYGIAKKHGTTINIICQLNGITSTTILKVGRKLRVK